MFPEIVIPFEAAIGLEESIVPHLRSGDDDLPTAATILNSPLPARPDRATRNDDLPLYYRGNSANSGPTAASIESRFQAHQSMWSPHLP